MAALIMIGALALLYIGFSVIQESMNPHTTTTEEERYASFQFGCGLLVLGIVLVFMSMAVLFSSNLASEGITYRNTF